MMEDGADNDVSIGAHILFSVSAVYQWIHCGICVVKFSVFAAEMTGKWGSVPKCPACDKSVYPVEQIFAADRKPFHRGCINCQARGWPLPKNI